MVSLFDMCLQKPIWAHLSTGIQTLDQMVEFQLDGIFDFQAVPSNHGVMAVACHLIVLHLSESEKNTVFVVETLNPFPWDAFRLHPNFDLSWEDSDQIQIFTCYSVVELFSFLEFGPGKQVDASVLLFMLNFHEIVELYRLDVAAAYEEALLRHQIDKNRVLLKNIDRIKEEGIELVSLPELPPNSGLLKENPYVKAQNHIDELFKSIAEFTYKNLAMVVLMGYMDAVYKPLRRSAVSQTPNSSFTQPNLSLSQIPREERGLVFEPMTFGLSGKPESLNESRITARLVFYDDWYYKCPKFVNSKKLIDVEDKYHVHVVKVHVPSGVSNIYDPVYFKIGEGEDWLEDLQVQDESNLSALIQNSLYSTLQAPRAVFTQISRQMAIPSSPRKILRSEIEGETDDDEDGNGENGECGECGENEREEREAEELYIDGSDVELTGTLLEDMSQI